MLVLPYTDIPIAKGTIATTVMLLLVLTLLWYLIQTRRNEMSKKQKQQIDKQAQEKAAWQAVKIMLAMILGDLSASELIDNCREVNQEVLVSINAEDAKMQGAADFIQCVAELDKGEVQTIKDIDQHCHPHLQTGTQNRTVSKARRWLIENS